MPTPRCGGSAANRCFGRCSGSSAALASTVLLYVAGLIVLSRGLGAANVIILAATLVCAYWPLRDWLKHRRLVKRGQESAVLVYEFLDRPREVGQVVGAEFLPASKSASNSRTCRCVTRTRAGCCSTTST